MDSDLLSNNQLHRQGIGSLLHIVAIEGSHRYLKGTKQLQLKMGDNEKMTETQLVAWEGNQMCFLRQKLVHRLQWSYHLLDPFDKTTVANGGKKAGTARKATRVGRAEVSIRKRGKAETLRK
ncbi:hypothetical protein ILUMI_24295 [Ignelater luminosus]|uniref:Uncharacterized protein n=1 Tax=Ignelater luminosus TaxID=2038154 RepID=A0A8K0G145_IGNLU|nr:hypothetical protein ILUMI_24295 [Ignelater luminosus]